MPEAPPALELTKQLIERRSITPDDGGCQELISARLQKAGFRCESMQFGDVTNLWARRGSSQPVVCFAGHTDVVPTGPLAEWHSDPFVPTVRDGKLYGRGAADMKGFIATALALLPEFKALDVKQPLHFAFSFDEEVGCVGVRRLLDDLKTAGIKPTLAIIGEPTSMRVVGAHKAGAVIETVAKGREGHSSAPE